MYVEKIGESGDEANPVIFGTYFDQTFPATLLWGTISSEVLFEEDTGQNNLTLLVYLHLVWKGATLHEKQRNVTLLLDMH